MSEAGVVRAVVRVLRKIGLRFGENSLFCLPGSLFGRKMIMVFTSRACSARSANPSPHAGARDRFGRRLRQANHRETPRTKNAPAAVYALRVLWVWRHISQAAINSSRIIAFDGMEQKANFRCAHVNRALAMGIAQVLSETRCAPPLPSESASRSRPIPHAWPPDRSPPPPWPC